jgi:hypothetical protein
LRCMTPLNDLDWPKLSGSVSRPGFRAPLISSLPYFILQQDWLKCETCSDSDRSPDRSMDRGIGGSMDRSMDQAGPK